MHTFRYGQKVKLVSFLNKQKPQTPIPENENFWNLIGVEGWIVSEGLNSHPAFPEKGPRALVKFDQDLKELGLINHNETVNSLWIFTSDLEAVS